MSSTIMSARIPDELVSSIDKFCRSSNITRTDYVKSMFRQGMTSAPDKLPKPTPNALNAIGAIAGGGLSAILIYQATKWALMKDDKYKEKDAENMAIMAAVSVGLISALGINLLLNQIDEA